MMRRLIAIFKNSLHTINAIVAVTIVAVYLITHFNLTGYLAKEALTGNLADYLGTEVLLENAEVDIFNQFVLENLLIKDQKNDTLFSARRVFVSFDILPLLKKELQIHTVQFVDFDIYLSRTDSISETNFQFLVDVFMPKDKDNRRKVLDDINLNSIILRNGRLTYDDYSKPFNNNYIDPNHLNFDNISSNLKIKLSADNGLYVRLKRLSLNECSGLTINKASTVIELDSEGKRLDFNDIRLLCEQTIETGHNAEINLVGFASMEKKKLNTEIQTFTIKAPEMLDLESSFKIDDLLSYSDDMKFVGNIDRLNISSQGLEYILNKASRHNNAKDKGLSLFLTYLNDIDEINVEGSAKGTLNKFIYLSNIECFGNLNADCSLKGVYNKLEPLNCDISASLRNIEIKKHKYEAIDVVGFLNNEYFDGSCSIDDPLCKVNAKGKYFYKKENRRVDAVANVETFDPYLLNISRLSNLEGLRFSANLLADINLRNKRYPQGQIRVDSLFLERQNSSLLIPEILVKSEKEDGQFFARVNSNYFNAIYQDNDGNESIEGELRESSELSEMFRLPLSVSKTATAKILLDSLHNIVNSEINLPEVIYNDAILELFLTSSQESDSLKHTLRLDCKKNNNHLASTFHATSLFDPLFVDIKPCKVILNNDEMECGGLTMAKLDANTYDLKRFSLKLREQSLNAKGKIASDGKSDLAIKIENLKFDTICSFLKSNYLKFGGVGSGVIYYTSDSARHVKTDNLFVKDFSYLGGVLGDTDLKASYDIDRTRIDLDAKVRSKEDSLSRISGYIQIAKKDSLDLYVQGNKFNIEFLNYWVGGFIEELNGNLSGDVHLYGLARELKLTGKPHVDAYFTNHLSGARFHLDDYISLTKEPHSEYGYFLMNNARLYDSFGHVAYANASIRHRYLRQYNYEVRIDFPNDNAGFLAFDKPTHYNNELYWGQLFTNGSVLLRGGGGKHRIEVSCKTTGKSFFNLSPGEENYSENGYNFLTFRDKEKFLDSEQGVYDDSSYFKNDNEDESSGTYIEFDLQAQATENCQVYVQMDPLAEDRLICRGNGDISLHYDPQHDITIGGVYNITEGNYLVTMRGDLINKEFKIQNGSRVLFPGNFSSTELDLKAVYSIPSVNLRDLDESFATLVSMNRTTLPVDCKLAVTGQLSAPQISFDLEVKNTSDDVQALVHNLIGTQEMLNREVFYLLLFSKFYSPDYASTSQNNSASQLSSFTSASLTSQLNNLLGHISDNFTLGTNFRSDKGDFSDMEMDVSLSTRLLGDRLILNGNLGYRDPANRVGLHNNTNSFIGDFDVEYLINPSGSLRAKAYSHYNERDYSINNALTTQGIGFVVRKDFKTIKELLFWKKISENK